MRNLYPYSCHPLTLTGLTYLLTYLLTLSVLDAGLVHSINFVHYAMNTIIMWHQLGYRTNYCAPKSMVLFSTKYMYMCV